MKQKFIVWGHKNNGHTHGYVHSSYYKAAKYLGFDAYWFDDHDNVGDFNFDNSIFLTEGQVERNIPINKTCKYILHHTNSEKYINNGLEFINLANYLRWCDDGVSAYHKENPVEVVNDFCFWDGITKTIYQPWATDLLPNEINIDNPIKYKPNATSINYIGTVHENFEQIMSFANIARKNNISFEALRTSSDFENMSLVQNSYLSLDLRGSWHLECGYLPCRIFKNLSYGRITGTNSENVKKKLGDHVIYNSNLELLFHELIEAEKTKPILDIQNTMRYIQENHTFVNRINNLLKFI